MPAFAVLESAGVRREPWRTATLRGTAVTLRGAGRSHPRSHRALHSVALRSRRAGPGALSARCGACRGSSYERKHNNTAPHMQSPAQE